MQLPGGIRIVCCADADTISTGIREYLPEDSRASRGLESHCAHRQHEEVREFSREDEPKLRIVFDNPAPGVLAPAIYERAGQRLAASLAWHFHHEDGGSIVRRARP